MKTTSLESLTCFGERRFELDWLRVIAFSILILYHVGMLYVPNWDFHYKSSYTSGILENVMLWSNQWRMSLLFLISGVATAFLLRKGTLGHFFVSRTAKIMVPFLFGLAVIVPPQIYIEMSSKSAIDMSYLAFWAAFLSQPHEIFDPMPKIGGIFVSFNHLWFLVYLATYTVLLVLMCFYVRLLNLDKLLHAILLKAPTSTSIIVPVIISILAINFLYDSYPPAHNLFADWFNHVRYFMAFLLGFVLMYSKRHWVYFKMQRKTLLVAALFSYFATIYAYNGGGFGPNPAIAKLLEQLCWSANAWLWISVVIGWGQHYLSVKNVMVRYLNRAIYCYYIVHQTVVLTAAFWLVPMHLGPILEPLLILVITVLVCVLSYEMLRHIPFISYCFGISSAKR